MLGADVVVLLAVAAAGLLAGRLVRLPPIPAYLVAGVVAGPGVLHWVSRTETVEQLAAVGVALLLFGVGIEFSLDRLRLRAARMAATGALQVAGTTAATAATLRLLGTPWATAVFAGFLVSASSTAIVFKEYADAGELDAPPGQAAAGILLFQDLALVPMMLLVPVLAHPGAHVLASVGTALLRAAVAVGALLVLARVVLPRALALVARARTPELFPLAAFLAAFGTAWAATALGLAIPIGTFLAGLALSGSPYAHHVFAELLPLRDAFVAVFFTSVGMLLAPAEALAHPALAAGMLLLVVGKGVLIAAIVALLWRSLGLGVLAGFALAQIGEFSFVLSRTGVAAGLMPDGAESAFLAVAILTMAATPLLLRVGRRLAEAAGARPTAVPASPLRDHVLVLGCGTTGQAVARVLRETGIPFLAVDLVAPVVEAARAENLPVRFGDASRRGVLEELGAPAARAAVVTVGDPGATRRIVSVLRQMNPRCRIIVRAQRVAEVEELERLGADDVVPSEFETSIELFVRLLGHMGVPRHVARVQESLIRLDRYQALRGVGASAELLAKAGQIIAGGILETAQVMEGSPACGRTIGELAIRQQTGATVLSVVRGAGPVAEVGPGTRLEAGDFVVLYGEHEAIDRALDVLEPPRDRRRPSTSGA
ncbi:MAG TPA: cation:proton antiporter [Candidatus Binatia bacterium]|nr:cation:proton antiporter [Candidatus Binatia bacterium]